MGTRAAASWWIFAALAGAGAVLLALTTPIGTDYVADTQPAIDALRAGDLAAFAADQPSMGPLSLWLRWPAAALADLAGGSDLLVYRLGALACLLVPAVVVTALVRTLQRSGAVDRGVLVALVAVLSLNPVTIRALELGHPEEPLGAALCLAAILLALGDRPRGAGVALGLALATKQWAVFAVVPVLLAAPPTRAAVRDVLVPAVAVAAVAYLPMLAADPGAFAAALERPVGGLGEMRPANLWHLVATQARPTPIGGGEVVEVQLVPAWLRTVAHPGIALLAVAVPAAWWWRRRARATPEQALALLALVFLLRCWLDPWNHEYYHLPFLLALGALEVAARRRPPVLTAVATAVLWVLFARVAAPGLGPGIDLAYLAWAVPMTAWLAAGAVAAGGAATLGGWTRTTSGTPTPIPDPSPGPSRIAA